MSSNNRTHLPNHRPEMASNPDPDPLAYETSIFQKGLHYEKPRFPFDSTSWEPLALSRLSIESKNYIHGSAGTRETDDKNRAAFRKWSIVPNRLVDTDNKMPDLSVTVLGQKLPFPIAIAPVGVQRIFNPDGEEAAARAAAKEKVPYTLSTASSTSIEDVASANGEGGVRWFQLYWPSRRHDDITISLLDRARRAGYSALIVTLDTYILGWRPADMDNGYNPFLRADKIGVEIGFTDPAFQKHFREKHGKEIKDDMAAAAPEWTRIVFPGYSHGWEDIKFLQEHWDGPIVLKGIQSVADAKKAAEVGVQGIIVSNHGGRQQDGGVSSLGMLPRIVDAVGEKIEVFFDSGVRCGADIAKALALGAKLVFVGRPYIYGLTLGGEDGVSHVLKALLGDLDLTLHLAGLPSVDKKILNRDALVREDDL